MGDTKSSRIIGPVVELKCPLLWTRRLMPSAAVISLFALTLCPPTTYQQAGVPLVVAFVLGAWQVPEPKVCARREEVEAGSGRPLGRACRVHAKKKKENDHSTHDVEGTSVALEISALCGLDEVE